MVNQASNKLEELKGRVKETAGKASKDRGLEARGKKEQLEAQSNQAAQGVKRQARKAKNTLSR
jgi:uncharacterized protein YjbJ (UPF0337 family)